MSGGVSKSGGVRVAYLVNQYPKVSHTFIRREILALEELDVQVDRYALRGWNGDAVDPVDLSERDRTTYTLKDGVFSLLLAAVRQSVRQPTKMWQAIKAAMTMAKGGMRPWPYHLIYVAHACRIIQHMEQRPVEHLHAHFGTNSAEIALLVRSMGGPPFSFTVHGMDEADNAPKLAFDEKIRGAAFAVAISAYTRSQLMRHVDPSLWNKIKIVHCGLPEHAFASAGAEEEGPQTPVFLCVGRLSGEKGHLILLDAFAKLHKNFPAARLVLAGDGDLRQSIEARIAALELGPSVRITGWIGSDQVQTEIQGCHVLVQPSLIEGLPVVIMEAMAQRRSVISTFVAGIPELVIPRENGWLVPAGTIDELVAAMEASITLPAQDTCKMRNAAFDRARERHSMVTEARKLKTLFAGEN